MKIIVGLGNPGKKYLNTRHNAGFLFLDHFAVLNSLSFVPSKHRYYKAEGALAGNPFVPVKPTTFVNLSGDAVIDVIDEYSVEVEDILVVHDEINIPSGTYKVKKSGSDGGHNGIYSIIYSIENDSFPRIRIGIGNDFPQGGMAEFVLSPFSADESEKLNKVFETCIELTKEFIVSGVKGLLDTNSKLSKRVENNPPESGQESLDTNSKLSKQDQTQKTINPGD